VTLAIPRLRRCAPVAVAAVALAGAVLASCGVPTEEGTRTLGTPPFGLLTTSTTVPPTTVPPGEGFRLTLYWVTPDDQIVPGNPIGLPTGPTFQQVVDLLVEGPPRESVPPNDPRTVPTTRSPAALRTYITEGLNPEPDGARHAAAGPLVREVENGVLDLLVDDSFRKASQETPTRFRLAIAQVVCTVTQFENVDTVRFFDSEGQLTLVNLEQIPIQTATRENIGDCDPE
jgi:hypothetical protein